MLFRSDTDNFGRVRRNLDFANVTNFTMTNRVIKVHNASCESVVFQPGESNVAAITNTAIAIWDLSKRECRTQYCINGNIVEDAVFDDRGHLVFCHLTENTIVVLDWNTSEDKVDQKPILVDSPISCVAFSRDGKQVGFISGRNEASVWDVKEHTVVANFHLGDTEDRFQAIAISWWDDLAACGSKNGTVKLWSTEKESFLWCGNVNSSIRWIWMQINFKCFLTVSDDNSIHVWDIKTGICYKHEVSYSETKSFVLSEDGKHLVMEDRKSTRLNSSHSGESRMPSSA